MRKTSGGRSVGIVRSRTQTMEFSFYMRNRMHSPTVKIPVSVCSDLMKAIRNPVETVGAPGIRTRYIPKINPTLQM
jgi:hypothetical protein